MQIAWTNRGLKGDEKVSLELHKAHWTGFGMVPFAFGKRCATVDAHGVRIGDRPVPNAQ